MTDIYLAVKKNGLFILLVLLCFFDAAATDFGIQKGYIREANPIMRTVYEESRIFFYSIKLGLPLLLLWIFPRTANQRRLRLLAAGCIAVYGAVGALHVIMFFLARSVQ